MSNSSQNERLHPWDGDLSPVLEKASNEDLEPLVQYILKAFNEELSEDNLYKRFQPNHVEYLPLIEREIRLFGGNTIANIFRGDVGPSYREIVCDVADKSKADFDKEAPIHEIERAIIIKLVSKAWDKLSDEQREELVREVGGDLGQGTKIPDATSLAAILALINLGGFASYQISVIVANQIAKQLLGHGLRFATNAAITRGLAILSSPIGWALTTIWAAVDIAGPKPSVTVPCVFHIAMLRQKYSLKLSMEGEKP